jgi:hypothetical protein
MKKVVALPNTRRMEVVSQEREGYDAAENKIRFRRIEEER